MTKDFKIFNHRFFIKFLFSVKNESKKRVIKERDRNIEKVIRGLEKEERYEECEFLHQLKSKVK